jgi:transcriptional regulator with XRE-family HTH domain
LLFSNQEERKKMLGEDKGFDGDGFYRALEATVTARSKNWKQVAAETGVSASTLTRMAQGRRPDAASLAALSAWAGLNPSDFVKAPYKATRPESMAQISTLLRGDPNLDAEGAEAVEAIVRAAYERLRKARE